MKIAIHKKRAGLYFLWGGVYLLFWLLIDLASHPDTFLKRVVNNVWLVAYLVAVNYVLFEFTFPFIRLQWKRALAAPFLLFAHLMLYSFGLFGWRQMGIAIGIYFKLIAHASVLKGVEYLVPYGLLSGIVIGVLKYTYDFRKLKETAQLLRIEKQEAELNFLKSQTNPHFLFNTLNNIYSLARDKSALAPESILRLSKILRYMLYETNGAFVPIEKEIKIIKDYIALEQLRYDDTLKITISCGVEDMQQPVPPLLLIPLVENAFKHGTEETRQQPFVDIQLSIEKRLLEFVVKNSTESRAEGRRLVENIGLSNLRRQLELLYREFDLTLYRENETFSAVLKINLGSHV